MAQARNSNSQLRLLGAKGEREAAMHEAADREQGGAEFDWTIIPDGIREESYAEEEWQRLATLYAHQPARFREADRRHLTTWCYWVQRVEEANDAICDDGLFVPGQSKRAQAAGLTVRHPAFAVLSQASNQLRFYGDKLGFSPASRRSAGIVEKEADDPNGVADLLSG